MFCLWVRLVVADCALLRFFMAQVCMNLAAFSFMACGELSTCMMLLISSFVRSMSRVFSLPLSCMFGICFPLPLFLSLGLLVCCLSLFVRMGLRPRWFLHALHSLWLLGCSPLQLTQLFFSSCGCSSVSWVLDLHSRHLGCLQLVVQCGSIPHLLHWSPWDLSSSGVIVTL